MRARPSVVPFAIDEVAFEAAAAQGSSSYVGGHYYTAMNEFFRMVFDLSRTLAKCTPTRCKQGDRSGNLPTTAQKASGRLVGSLFSSHHAGNDTAAIMPSSDLTCSELLSTKALNREAILNCLRTMMTRCISNVNHSMILHH
jgi:hypothetical protein